VKIIAMQKKAEQKSGVDDCYSKKLIATQKIKAK